MEVTALCFRLMLNVLVLLFVQVHHNYFAQKVDAAFPRVRPDRLQFFEYETVTVNCEEFRGLTEWRVMMKLKEMDPINSYNSSSPSHNIDPTVKRHSGEYWCEDGEGNKSRAVNISVTDGLVILEIPAHPVVEGDDVTLHCKEISETKQISDFYKNGVHLGTLYENNLILQNVSKSDEGLYRCSISLDSGLSESPESWLTVSTEREAPNTEALPPRSKPMNLLSLLWIVALAAPLLLLVKKLPFFRKNEEPDVSAADSVQLLPDDSAVYTTVYYRSLGTNAGRRRWSVQDSN